MTAAGVTFDDLASAVGVKPLTVKAWTKHGGLRAAAKAALGFSALGISVDVNALLSDVIRHQMRPDLYPGRGERGGMMSGAPTTVIDWSKKPEPWRSVGLAFCEELRGQLAAPRPAEPSAKRPDRLSPPKETGATPGARLTNLRLSKGLSQQSLGDVAGRHRMTISTAETERPIRRSSRLAIASALGVSVTDIWPVS